MRLSNFEDFVDAVILRRGQDYFDSGSIESIEMSGENHYSVEVVGTEFYSVDVFINGTDEIVDTTCECPYDWGEFCKHQVAAFYAIRDLKNEEINTTKPKPLNNKKVDLKSILLNLKKEDLINIILDISKEHNEIESKLLFKFSSNKDEITASKKLMREFINSAKKRGFIEWDKVSDALEGAYITLEKAEDKMSSGDTETAVLLCLAVLSIVVDMIQYCDDSNGNVGEVIDQSFWIIDEALSIGADQLNESEHKKLFEVLMKEALNQRYDGWIDWQVNLLGACVYFSSVQPLRQKLESQLEIMLKNPSDSWSAKYETENLKLLQLRIIEKYDGAQKATQFINENIHLSPFREKAIERLLKENDYEEVIKLCEQGESMDREYRGLVGKWKEYRLKAYTGLGDISKQKELLLEFIYANQYGYYLRLKKLYSPNEWEVILEDILATLEKQSYTPTVYLEILKEEKLKDKLLQYCRNHNSSIQYLYEYLIDDYFDEVNEIYLKFLEVEAAHSSDRKKYRNVCKMIKAYQKVCGDDHAQILVRKLMTLYFKRPAFIDELSKLKLLD